MFCIVIQRILWLLLRFSNVSYSSYFGKKTIHFLFYNKIVRLYFFMFIFCFFALLEKYYFIDFLKWRWFCQFLFWFPHPPSNLYYSLSVQSKKRNVMLLLIFNLNLSTFFEVKLFEQKFCPADENGFSDHFWVIF